MWWYILCNVAPFLQSWWVAGFTFTRLLNNQTSYGEVVIQSSCENESRKCKNGCLKEKTYCRGMQVGCPGRGFSNLCKKGSLQASSRWRIFKAVQKWKQANKLQVEEFSKLCKNGSKQAGSRWRIFQRCAKMEASKQAPGNCAIVCMQCTDQRGTNSHSCRRRSGKSTVECQGFRPWWTLASSSSSSCCCCCNVPLWALSTPVQSLMLNEQPSSIPKSLKDRRNWARVMLKFIRRT